MRKITHEDPISQSLGIVNENVERLKALFPEAFIEGSIDFEVLKQLLGGKVEEKEEKYGMNWHGKRSARQLALTPSVGTLRPYPEESTNWDFTKNLVIEGDNLEVLKLMQKGYAGKVKIIYIDPPYNTGKDFVYPDDFTDNIKNYHIITGQVDGEGRKISSNTENSGRYHTDWLNMMYPRLKLARNLLSDDGVIFCSIDDKEVSRLRNLLDEIFGEENFLTQFIWRTDGNFDNQAKIKVCHEYILLFAKSANNFPHPPVVDPNTPSDSKLFKPEIRNTIIKNGPKNPVSKIVLPKGFPADFEFGEIPSRSTPWPMYLNKAVVEGGKLVNSVTVESGWSSKELLSEYISNGFDPVKDNKGQETTFHISKTGAIEVVKRRSDYQSHVVSVLNGFGGPQKANTQLSEIGAFFNGYPKPIELIRYFVQMVFGMDGIVLDFFAGSGTTGHAVMEQNVADGGNRRYILVQLPEPLKIDNKDQKLAAEYCEQIGIPPTISELTKERLRRAAEKIKTKAADSVQNVDLGFRVFKLDSSNIRAWEPDRENLEQTLFDHTDHLKVDRSVDDILYELLLKLGIDLSTIIESRLIANKLVYAVGGGALLVCLDANISQEEAEPLALGLIQWHKELDTAGKVTCLFRDSSFIDDVTKANLTAILQQNGLENVRSL